MGCIERKPVSCLSPNDPIADVGAKSKLLHMNAMSEVTNDEDGNGKGGIGELQADCGR